MPQDPPPPEPIDISNLTGQPDPTDRQPVSTGSKYFLTEDDLDEHTKLGEEGEIESAIMVLNYYSFSNHSETEELYWLEKCAILGHPVSQYNYAHRLFEKGLYKKSLEWAKKALECGIESAAFLIERIEKHKK